MKKRLILFFLLITSTITAQKVSVVPVQYAPHPRLFFGRGEEDAVKERAKHNALLADLIGMLRSEADKYLDAAPQAYKPDAELLNISREEIARLLTLSMAYRLFGEEKYAHKAEAELLHVSAFPSWHPEHFLDVAEMATAVAIGYDWCYDFLSPSTRERAEEAIRQNAFAPAWPIYAITDKQTPFNRENNWNMVCNAGMVNAALAIGDKYPKEAERVIGYAVQYTPHLLESFAPEGVYNEGPGYWAYNSMYMALLFDNLERHVHNGFGLPAFKGIAQTPRFYANLVGPSGLMFNFGDASTRVDNSGTFFYLSKYYHLPEAAAFYRQLLQTALQQRNNPDYEVSRFFFLSIPWFDDARSSNGTEKKLTVFQGVTDFLIINGGPASDTSRLYLAAKTGRPAWSHNQLDVGSFVLDCDGQRWGIDLGADSYSQPKFWSYEPGGQRWKYFRNTNLAHNTLSIDDSITLSTGQGELLRYNDRSARPYGIFDLTPAYAGQASSVQRGFRLLAPDAILLRDEAKGLKPGARLTWRFLTNAQVAVNGNQAVLSQAGKQFYIRCLLPGGYTIRVTDAKPYAATEKPIRNTRIVEIATTAADGIACIPVLLGKRGKEWGDKEGAATLQAWK